MARNLDFTVLEQNRAQEPKQDPSGRSRRWKRREANPTVQMSVRMKEDVYEKFRELAERERYTNGEMLELMLEHWCNCTKGRNKPNG